MSRVKRCVVVSLLIGAAAVSGLVFWGDFHGTRADRVSIDAAGFHQAGAYQISVAIPPRNPTSSARRR